MVEHDLAKAGVEGPSPFSRSKKEKPPIRWLSFFIDREGPDPRPLGGEDATKQRGARSACELFRNSRPKGREARQGKELAGRRPETSDESIPLTAHSISYKRKRLVQKERGEFLA